MTIGIYALYWEEQDLIYIGQSINIERRFKEHKRLMSNNTHYNYKLQQQFNKQNKYYEIVIEETKIPSLTNSEIGWINEFNSIKSGLNILEPDNLSSTECINSKYSKIEVLLVFRALTRTNVIATKDICEKYLVPNYLVDQIRSTINHVWLENRYPYLYQRMKDLSARQKYLSRSKSRVNVSIKSCIKPVEVIDPLNNSYTITHVKNFSKEHNLDYTSMLRLIGKKISAYKGWKLMK